MPASFAGKKHQFRTKPIRESLSDSIGEENALDLDHCLTDHPSSTRVSSSWEAWPLQTEIKSLLFMNGIVEYETNSTTLAR
jgi:hypothetical protein